MLAVVSSERRHIFYVAIFFTFQPQSFEGHASMLEIWHHFGPISFIIYRCFHLTFESRLIDENFSTSDTIIFTSVKIHISAIVVTSSIDDIPTTGGVQP